MPSIATSLALVVGHTRERPGAMAAAPLSVPEYVYNRQLATRVEAVGPARGVTVRTFLRDEVGIEGVYRAVSDWEPDASIELHFNAFNKKVRGTETLFADDNDAKGVMEVEFAGEVQRAMCKALKRPPDLDRGLKKRPLSKGERGFKSINQLTQLPTILVEPFFGDNPADAALGAKALDDLAVAFAEAIIAWRKRTFRERERERKAYFKAGATHL